jgi:hypothetical protein
VLSTRAARTLAYAAAFGALLFGASGCGYQMYTRPGLPAAPVATTDEISLRLLLVGDLGDEVITRPQGWPLLDRLTGDLRPDVRSAIVFLGDNVYPAGVPAEPDTSEARMAERIVRATLAAAAPADDVIFVPGNHDWNDSHPGGHERVLAQQALIARLTQPADRARVIPSGGCPGPASLDLSPLVRLVAVDTEWLLTDDDPRRKPIGGQTGCVYGSIEAPTPFPDDQLTAEAFYRALEAQLQGVEGRVVILLAHHPLRSRGPHGGHLGGTWLPFIWPAVKRLFPTPQDFGSNANQRMRARIDEVLGRTDAGLIVAAAGHDHNLQLFEASGGAYYLVSGSGSKTSPAGRTPQTLFKHGAHGYMRVDVLVDGNVQLAVVEPGTDRPPLSMRLRRRE